MAIEKNYCGDSLPLKGLVHPKLNAHSPQQHSPHDFNLLKYVIVVTFAWYL